MPGTSHASHSQSLPVMPVRHLADVLDVFVLISDVVRLSGTYLILLIRIRLYLCRLDYIFYCTYHLGYPYCPSTLGRLIVLSLLFSLGTFFFFPMFYCFF